MLSIRPDIVKTERSLPHQQVQDLRWPAIRGLSAFRQYNIDVSYAHAIYKTGIAHGAVM